MLQDHCNPLYIFVQVTFGFNVVGFKATVLIVLWFPFPVSIWASCWSGTSSPHMLIISSLNLTPNPNTVELIEYLLYTEV